MNVPDDLKYTSDHEWARLEGDSVTVGVTDFAQGELSDIIFVEFPKVGQKFSSGDTFGTVEAVKTVAGRDKLEASGGITFETIRDKAATGVDFVSVGRMTQSAPAVDIGLDYDA